MFNVYNVNNYISNMVQNLTYRAVPTSLMRLPDTQVDYI